MRNDHQLPNLYNYVFLDRNCLPKNHGHSKVKIPEYAGQRTMWRHPDTGSTWFVTDEDRASNTLLYRTKWDWLLSGLAVDRIFLPHEVEFFPAPKRKRRG